MDIPKPHLHVRYVLKLCCFLVASLQAQDCEPTDCVWPGDANHNGICNNMDLLWMGMAFNEGGPMRDDPSFTWTPQAADDWAQTHPMSGTNYKYADTDGNGFVEGVDFDVFPILYGQTNDQFTGLLGNELPGDDLFIVLSDPNPQAGQTVDIFIHLGSPENPVNDLAGIAFTLDLDTDYIQEDQTFVDPHGGWLGTPWEDLFNFGKTDEPSGLNDPEFAFARLSGTPVSGHGEIARVQIVIEDVIVGHGGQPVDSVTLEIDFKRVLGLNYEEQDLQITAQSYALSLLTPTNETLPEATVQVIPQAQQLLLRADRQIDAYQLVDPLGRTIRRQQTHTIELTIPTMGLPAGVYVLQLLIDGQLQSIPVYIDPG